MEEDSFEDWERRPLMGAPVDEWSASYSPVRQCMTTFFILLERLLSRLCQIFGYAYLEEDSMQSTGEDEESTDWARTFIREPGRR
jgi:hypothetical protein